MATEKNSPAAAERNPTNSNGATHAPPSDAALKLLFKQFESCRALMTAAEVSKIEQVLFATDGRRTVRAGLFMLTRSGREMLDTMRGAPEMVSVYEELAACATDRAAKLRHIADALDTASARLALALCDA